jgi:hypothetical protein
LENEVIGISSQFINMDIRLGSPGGKTGWSDVVRICVLYKYGGLYFDLDNMFLRDIKPLFSYRNFVYSWEWHNYANSAIMYVESPQNDAITKVVENCIVNKTCHPNKIFKFSSEIPGMYVLPTYVFDPSWSGCV